MTDQIDLDAANALIPVVRKAASAHIQSERGGMGGSMNSAMDLLELEIVAKMRELGWTPPATQPTAAVGEAWEGPPYEYGYTWGPEDGPGNTDRHIQGAPAEVERMAKALRGIKAYENGGHIWATTLHGVDALMEGAKALAAYDAAPPATQPIATVGEVCGKWHRMLLALVNAIHRDQGEKTQTIGLNISYEQALAMVSHTPPPVATATVVDADWALPDLRDVHNDIERIRDHDLGNSRMSELLRGVMDMLRAADVEYAMYGATPTPPAGDQ